MNNTRCFGDNEPDYHYYHDNEWGKPVHDENLLFEQIVLEGFQAGLSWLTILRKRNEFRAAFAGFDPAKVALFDEKKFEELMADSGIIRNRQKIKAAIKNAQATTRLHKNGETLDELIWSFATNESKLPKTWSDVPVSTPESKALASALKARGFVFVGPTTMYAMMQSVGVVNDHLEDCIFHKK